MIVINWLFRKRKKTLREKFLSNITRVFRSIDQQPFTTEAEGEVDTLIEIEKAFNKATKEKIALFYCELAIALSHLGKTGFYDASTGILVFNAGDSELGEVIHIRSDGNTIPRDLLVYPDGEYTLLESSTFPEVIRFLQLVTTRVKNGVGGLTPLKNSK